MIITMRDAGVDHIHLQFPEISIVMSLEEHLCLDAHVFLFFEELQLACHIVWCSLRVQPPASRDESSCLIHHVAMMSV